MVSNRKGHLVMMFSARGNTSYFKTFSMMELFPADSLPMVCGRAGRVSGNYTELWQCGWRTLTITVGSGNVPGGTLVLLSTVLITCAVLCSTVS